MSIKKNFWSRNKNFWSIKKKVAFHVGKVRFMDGLLVEIIFIVGPFVGAAIAAGIWKVIDCEKK